MRYTIVRSNRLNTFPSNICKNVQVIPMFGNLSFVRKILLELKLQLHKCISEDYFNPKLKDVDSDILIVFDGHARPEFLRWLAKNNREKRLIFWCWNTVDEIKNNLELSGIPEEYELWSYSESDCKKYKLKYNTTFYWREPKRLDEILIENDIYFIGKDKSRFEKIKRIEKQLREAGIKCKFQIIPTHPWNIKYGTVRKIPYSQVIENIQKSKAIMDIKASKTAGPTLRAIEAAFYKKKIVSDDMDIMKMKFYKPQNTYIIRGGY